MATGNAVDFKYYQYTADDGTTWSVKVDKTWGDNAAAGFGAMDPADPVFPRTGRYRPRQVRLQDMVSTRTTQRVVGSNAVDLWTVKGETVTSVVRGAAGTVTLTKIGKIDERIPTGLAITSKAEPVTA